MIRLLFSGAVLFASASCTTQSNVSQNEVELTKEERTAIRQVIEEETVAFARRDSTRLFNSFADDPVTQSCWNNADGTYSIVPGKEAIVKSYSNIFRARPGKIQLPEIERTEWVFRKLGTDWVWVNFVQAFTGSEKLNRAYESRLMKKENGEWKTVVVNALNDQSRAH